MLLKISSAGIGIAVPVTIVRVLHMTKISNPCCLNVAYSSPELLMVGCAYTIL